MPLRWPRLTRRPVAETVQQKTRASMPAPAKAVERAGYVDGVPQGGLNEYQSGVGASTETDRQSTLRELWEAYLSCPWAWACVTAISRTVTGGGLVMDWDQDDGEGDQDTPDKPPAVLAFERFIKYCNPTQDIRQLLRNTVADLLVFADAFIEVVWWAGIPVALYNLDSPTTSPVTDDHGNVLKYVQVTQYGQRAEFETRQVIHISLDSARPGVFGVAPTQAALLPITTWLFVAACLKQTAKKGCPPAIHADLPAAMSRGEVKRWTQEYASENLGTANIGTPITTKGGGKVAELKTGSIADLISAKSQSRDEIVSSYGVPPAKVGIIESGNLGGGTGTEQNKTYEIDTCGPIADLILEKIQFALVEQAFKITGWRVKFGEVDYRADEAIESIRDQRLRNGSWTLNKYRATIGEPPVDGGDDAVLVDRQNLVLWKDMADMSAAQVAAKGAPATAAGEEPPNDEPMQDGDEAQPGAKPGPQPPAAKAPAKGQAKTPLARAKPKPVQAGPGQESVRVVQLERYRRRIEEAISRMPVTEDTPSTGQDVYDRLASCFPASKLGWVKNVEWEGPMNVGAGQIDTEHLAEWAASHDGPDIDRLRAKALKRKAQGRHLKPVVLVRPHGSAKDIIVDGHHHALAAMKEGLPIWAYVGRVDAVTGPWDEEHLYQQKAA